MRIWRNLFHLQTDLIVCNNNINSLVLLQGCFFVILSYQVAKTVFYALPMYIVCSLHLTVQMREKAISKFARQDIFNLLLITTG